MSDADMTSASRDMGLWPMLRVYGTAQRHVSRGTRAFTLLELVLVMVIACLALALVAPSLSAWGHGAQLRDLADQFVSLTRLARSRAVADGLTYRINIDAKSGTYQLTVQSGANFAPMQSA